MKNIQISLTAKNYADALVKLGQDNVISYDDILNNLEIISEICTQSKDLTGVLENPAISDETKFSIIDEVFTKYVNVKIRDFLKILIEKKRFKELEGIVAAYQEELDKINNLQRVEVISAVELDDNSKQRIIEKLQKRLQKNVIAQWQTDEEIIGGLVVKINDDVIDSSLKNKLENLSKNII
ncbi:aTP synthase subunit delta [Clostridium sp. CAG:967]|nr:aTP synthase subunit delta [Clostridium sp. CAG:967]